MTKDDKYITIYHNKNKILELTQRLNIGIIEEEKITASNNEEKNRNKGVNAAVDGKAKIPSIADVGSKLGVDLSSNTAKNSNFSSEYTRVFSEQYYLKHVIDLLSKDNSLNIVDDKQKIPNLKTGDFIIFKSSFVPNPVDSLFDSVSTDLIVSIINILTYNKTKSEIEARFPGGITTDAKSEKIVEKIKEKNLESKNSKIELATSVYSILEQQFKNNNIEEIHGVLNKNSNVVLDCEHEWFNTNNSTQIYNGEYTIFGKVASQNQNSLSKFSSNKLLKITGEQELINLLTYLKTEFEKGLKQGDVKNASIIFMSNILENISNNVLGVKNTQGINYRVIPLAIYV